MATVADRAQTSPTEPVLHTCDDTSRILRPRIAEPQTTPLVARAVRAAQRGDRDALRFLYARYADDVYTYVRTIVAEDGEALHVTRHVFAGLEDMLDRYEEREAPFSVWVRRVARSVAADAVL